MRPSRWAWIAVLLIVAGATGLFASGQAGAGGGKPAAEESFVLKFACHENEKHAQATGLFKAKEVIEKLSGGKITIQLYFNSSLYTQTAEQDAILSGELETAFSSAQVLADYVPELAMLTTPYMYSSYDHMEAVLNGDLGRKEIFTKVSDKLNCVVLGAWYNGSRQLNLRSNKPVTRPEDMKGIVLRMPNSAAWIAVGESLGAKVTPLAYGEVYTALQTGTIDAQDNPMPADKMMKFYEVTKQISLTYHIIDAVWPVITKGIWNRMSSGQRDMIYKAFDEGRKACEAQIMKEEKELVAFFKEQGLIITNPDIPAFKKYAYDYYVSTGRTKTWNMDLYNRIQALAK